MKAIKFDNKFYSIESERGDYYYAKDNRGKIKCFLKSEVEIVEIDALPKAKTYKTAKRVEAPADPIQTWKGIALSVNNKWNENATWKLAEQTFGRLNADGNSFIESLLDSMFTKGRLSEKQAYFLAKYGVDSGQLK